MISRQPTYALKNMIRALGFHPWLNTEEDKARLAEAKAELRRRAKAKRLAKKTSQKVSN